MIRVCLIAVCASVQSSLVFAGVIQGQARDLQGDEVANVTVTVVRGNQMLARQVARDGRYRVTIPEVALAQNDKAVTVLFTAPGRDDARLDNLFALTDATIDMVLPIKYSAPEPCYNGCIRGRRWFRGRR